MYSKLKVFCSIVCMFLSTTVLHAQDSGWAVNPHDYQYDMTVYGSLVVDGATVTDFENYEIAAFVGDECRGLAQVNSQGGYTWLYLRVRSNVASGETVMFRVLDKDKGKICKAVETIVFASNGQEGMPSAPVTFTLRSFNLSAISSNEAMGTAELSPEGVVENGTSVIATATPVAGYEFVNWTVGDQVKSTDNPFTFEATEDLALVANFKARKYNVSFDVDGTVTTNSMDFGSVITAPAAPTKRGYTFAGWSPAFVEGATVPVDGITYTATWTINQYTITFDTDGGSEVAAITQDYASDVTAPADPTKTGYTFKGWDKEIPTTMPAENVTIKAQWQINQYTITFDTDGGSEVASITQDYASDVTAPADPTKTGYTFKGWDKEIPATIPAEDVTIKAQWQINQYTVKFVADGEVVSEEFLDYGTAITAPEAPAKEGYTFTGWTPEVDETVPANDVTYEAEYTINTYKLTYVLDDVEVKTIEVEYGAEIEEFVPEVEDGYEFAGWEDVPATMPAHDVTIYGSTTIDTFISSHFANSGKSVTVYTLHGTRVMTLDKASDIKRLSRGTYIINGRKVNIRK